jgi:hypothetical protein
MRANLKKCIASFSLLIVAQFGWAQTHEDFLNAPDRIEWEAGGLYDGRFDDGTPFQIQLAYPRPAAVSNRAQAVWNAYWFARHFTGERIVLSAEAAPAGSIKLVQWKPIRVVVETFSITLAPDRLSGTGNWTSSKPGEQRSFVLHRSVLYKEVAVMRPAAPGASVNPGPLVFSALFPLLTDAATNDAMRKTLGRCSDTTECANSVIVTWRSPSLLSLDATTYGYTFPGAHGESHSSTRHYRLHDEKMTRVGLADFLEPGPGCRAKVSGAIVAKLTAQKMVWAQSGALDKRRDPKFLALPDGLEFHFDPYEVGNYAQGSPSVFLSRAELDQCVRNLPSAD